jgi:CHAT domain-containing protein/Tfp pilus assembly protein PilF
MTVKNHTSDNNIHNKFYSQQRQKLYNRFLLITPISFLLFLSTLCFFNCPTFSAKAKELAQSVDNSRTEVNHLYQEGEQLVKLGKYNAALPIFQKALVIYQKIGDRRGEGLVHNYLGIANKNLNKFPQALKHYQQALAIFKEFSESLNVGTALNNIASIYDSSGQYSQALEFYEQALAIRREVGDRLGEGVTLSGLGLVYRNLGQYSKAIEFYEKALVAREEVGDLQGEGSTLNNLGESYRNLEQYSKAQIFYLKALKIFRKLGNLQGEASTLNNLGDFYRHLGQYPLAVKNFQQALALFSQIGVRHGEGITRSNIGRVYTYQGLYTQAIESFQQSLAIFREANERADEGRTLRYIGETLYQSGQLEEAERTLNSAVEIFESLRLSLSDINKVSIFEIQTDIYRLLQQVLIARNMSGTALEIAERGRSRAFVELLTRRLSSNPNDLSPVAPLNLSQIKRIAADQHSTLVEYSIIKDDFIIQGKVRKKESELYIWVIQPTGEVIFRKTNIKLLWQQQNTSLVKLISNSLKDIGIRGRGGSILVEALSQADRVQRLKQLYGLLISPIADLMPADPKSRIIFMPQEELFSVPFPALQDDNGRYLIEKHTIVTAPSIQVLALTRQQHTKLQKVKPQEIIVVGNPSMPKVTLKIGEPPEQLYSLPAAKQEAIDIAKLFHTDALIGPDASKAKILLKLSQAKIVHFATHGLLDDFKGLGVPGAIALAPSGTGEVNDGLLTANEILDLKLSAELVVLSACDTGRGRITGDGVIGLSRSLITAGVPSVIVSLWSVPDSPTAKLMVEFYRNWRERKMDKAQSLRQAMLTTMKTHSNPRNWAAFTLIGEAE